MHLRFSVGHVLRNQPVRAVEAFAFCQKPLKNPFCGMALLPGSLTVIQEPLINQWLICIQLRAHIFRILFFWFRCVKIGHVQILTYRFPVMPRLSSNSRDTFPLLIKELSDRMNLVHCNHTPFLLECCLQRHSKDTKSAVCLQWMFGVSLNLPPE